MKKRLFGLFAILSMVFILASCGNKEKTQSKSELEKYADVVSASILEVEKSSTSMVISEGTVVVYKKIVDTTVNKTAHSAKVVTTVYELDSSFELSKDTTEATIDNYDETKLIGFTLTKECVPSYELAEGVLSFKLSAADASKFVNSTISSASDIDFSITVENEKITKFGYNYTLSSGRTVVIETVYSY